MSAFEILGYVLVAGGSLTFFTAGLGIVRFPDVYTRASAVATASGLGVAMIVFGVVFLQPSVSVAVKAVAVVLLQLATAAIGSMTIARAAYLTGVPLMRKNFDELAPKPSDD
jgi:multicomponent Na+:H+ antiporter subunit G